MALHLLKGKNAELFARRHLEQQGMRLVEANYHCKMGEIDLIMRDRDMLVFVEVRYRRSAAFGSATESITPGKQHKLLAAARQYLQQYRASIPCRFDVVGITGQNGMNNIEWIRDAFQSDEVY